MLCEEPARVEFLPPNPAHDDAAPFSPKDDLARILALSGTDQCPLYLSRFSTYTPPDKMRWACCSERWQQSAISRLRHETCDGRIVSVPRLLSALHGRTLSLVGDSTMNQMFDMLGARLDAAGEVSEITRRRAEHNLEARHYAQDAVCSERTTAGDRPRTGGSTARFRLEPGEWRASVRARASECASLTRASSRGLGARRCSLLSCNGTSGKKAFEALCRQLPDEIWTPPCIVLCHMIEALRRQLPDEEIWVRRANATIRFYRTDGPFAKPKAGACGTAAAFSRRIAAAASGADILVANVGMHYNRRGVCRRAARKVSRRGLVVDASP